MSSDAVERPLNRPASLAELFIAFTRLALQGFGGVLAVSERVLCDERRWLTRAQYVELLAVGQVLPGPNICNLALMIGDRFFGWRGAFTALAGIMLVPLAIVLALTALQAQFVGVPAVDGALRGMGAVAAGLIAAMALKLMPALRSNALRAPACALLGGAAFVAVALLHLPLPWVLLGLGGFACAWAWMRVGAAPSKREGGA